MRRTVFRVLTPNTQHGNHQTASRIIHPDTLYNICSRIAKGIIILRKSSAGGGALY